MSPTNDPRITEILELAAEEGLPLALAPATICALEDEGYLVDVFTGLFWPDPDGLLALPAPGPAHGRAA